MKRKVKVGKHKKFSRMAAFGISVLLTFLNILPSPIALAGGDTVVVFADGQTTAVPTKPTGQTTSSTVNPSIGVPIMPVSVGESSALSHSDKAPVKEEAPAAGANSGSQVGIVVGGGHRRGLSQEESEALLPKRTGPFVEPDFNSLKAKPGLAPLLPSLAPLTFSAPNQTAVDAIARFANADGTVPEGNLKSLAQFVQAASRFPGHGTITTDMLRGVRLVTRTDQLPNSVQAVMQENLLNFVPLALTFPNEAASKKFLQTFMGNPRWTDVGGMIPKNDITPGHPFASFPGLAIAGSWAETVLHELRHQIDRYKFSYNRGEMIGDAPYLSRPSYLAIAPTESPAREASVARTAALRIMGRLVNDGSGMGGGAGTPIQTKLANTFGRLFARLPGYLLDRILYNSPSEQAFLRWAAVTDAQLDEIARLDLAAQASGAQQPPAQFRPTVPEVPAPAPATPSASQPAVPAPVVSLAVRQAIDQAIAAEKKATASPLVLNADKAKAEAIKTASAVAAALTAQGKLPMTASKKQKAAATAAEANRVKTETAAAPLRKAVTDAWEKAVKIADEELIAAKAKLATAEKNAAISPLVLNADKAKAKAIETAAAAAAALTAQGNLPKAASKKQKDDAALAVKNTKAAADAAEAKRKATETTAAPLRQAITDAKDAVTRAEATKTAASRG